MTAVAKVAAELDALEKLQAQLAAVSSRTDAARRHDLVRLRRQLADQVARIGQTAEPLFAAWPARIPAYREHFSAMRSALALHQAEWPAIRLGEADADHERSAASVREKNRAFLEWMRAALATMAQPGATRTP